MDKVASIKGITSQDSSNLKQLLLKKEFAVHGIKRRGCIKSRQGIK